MTRRIYFAEDVVCFGMHVIEGSGHHRPHRFDGRLERVGDAMKDRFCGPRYVQLNCVQTVDGSGNAVVTQPSVRVDSAPNAVGRPPDQRRRLADLCLGFFLHLVEGAHNLALHPVGRVLHHRAAVVDVLQHPGTAHVVIVYCHRSSEFPRHVVDDVGLGAVAGLACGDRVVNRLILLAGDPYVRLGHHRDKGVLQIHFSQSAGV